MVRGLTIRKDYTFLLCIYFHQYISLGERNESVRMKAGYLMMVIMYESTTQRYYFPGCLVWWRNLWNVIWKVKE